MFFHTSSNSQNIGIEYDVIRVESNFLSENVIRASTYLYFPVSVCCLPEFNKLLLHIGNPLYDMFFNVISQTLLS